MRRIKKQLACCLTAMVISLAFAIPAYADPFGDLGSPTPDVDVRSPDYNEIWNPAIETAITTWNKTPTSVLISYTTNSENYIEAQQYSESWYGMCTQWPGGDYHYTIQLNSKTISNDAWNINGFIQGVTVHEFGHVFWLSDNPTTSQDSIMKYSHDWNTMTEPQQFDIDNVNLHYRSNYSASNK